MKQGQYLTLLVNRLISKVKEWFPNDENLIFMQCGASYHTAKRVKGFLVHKNINFLPCPGNSSDLNPTENIWELVEREIAKETNNNENKTN